MKTILDARGNPIQLGYFGARPNWKRTQDPLEHTSILATEEQVLNQQSRSQLLSTLRDLERNNCICKAIVQTFISNLGKCNFVSQTEDEEYNTQRDKHFSRYFKKCELSGNGLNYVLQAIATDLLLSGEIFILLTRGSSIQLIPSERVCSSIHKAKRKQNENDGLVFDRYGQIKQFRISKIKDGFVDMDDGFYVPSKDIIHVKNTSRVGQYRGTPLLAPATQTLMDIHAVQTAFTNKVKASSALVGFITSNQPYSEKYNFNDYDDDQMRSTYSKLHSGSLLILENGESVETIQGGNIDGVDRFLTQLISFACSSIGITHENLVGWSNASFSSSKSTRAVTNHRFAMFREFIEETFLNRLALWKSNKAENEDEISSPNLEEYHDNFSWNWNKASSLDRRQDAQTDALLIQNNLSSHSEVFANNGKDFQVEAEQMMKDKALLKELQEKYSLNEDNESQ